MSETAYEVVVKEGRERARATAVWDARFCIKEAWDYLLETIPHDAIGADMTKHAPHNSNSPMVWYRDKWFLCKDCGRAEVWTAKSQRWWFEVAKGQINSTAVRCRACRRARREKRSKSAVPKE